ncbi:LytR/AlgR family response regulator transcription factor [Phocaeicola sp.]
MIRCLAIDDEPLALEQLKKYIGKVPFLELVATCQDAFEAMKLLTETSVDAIFIDINMPDLNGVDFVRSLIERPLVVFTTAYSEYAIDGYKVDAVDYLLKPFGFEDFQRAANKVRRQWELLASSVKVQPSVNAGEDVLYLKSDYRMVRVNMKDICYVEGMSEYLRIYLDGEPKPLITLLSMKKLEERLPADMFMRVHRSYIVNLKKIEEVARLRIVLNKDTYIPIGELYKEQFYKYVNNKFVSK